MISPTFKAKILSIDLKNNIDSSYTKFKIFKPTFYMVSAFLLKRVKYTTFALGSPGVGHIGRQMMAWHASCPISTIAVTVPC